LVSPHGAWRTTVDTLLPAAFALTR
jgi:hypothetical protein